MALTSLYMWLSWQRIHLQCGRPGFDPWVGKFPWRRERPPVPVFWPGEFHGLCRPWGHKEPGTNELLSLTSSLEEGNLDAERQTQRRPRQTGAEMGAVHPEAEECRGFGSPPEARREAQNRPFLRVRRVSTALPHLDVGLPASRIARE